ncbi:MAG: ATP-binding protein [Lachnospiraceae bacterium]|nr:ATP-binding protein [Lachnospiraceae bacterium]
MNNKVNSQQLQGILRTVILAGSIQILCILMSMGALLFVQKHYRSAIDEAYQVTTELNELSQYLYRYQNIMSDYLHHVSENEAYLQEAQYTREIIQDLLNSSEIMIQNIDSEQLTQGFEDFKKNIGEYLELEQDNASIQTLTSYFKTCTSQQGMVGMYITEYSNSCKKASDVAEIVMTVFNVIMIITAIISVYNSYKYAAKYGEELNTLKEKADAANVAKSSFLANMSHEIRTPINAVLSMDEMILRESKDSQIKEYAQDIKTAGNTLLSLINDILDLSKIESGKMELVESNYCIKDIIKDVNVLISEKAKAKGLKFEQNISPNMPTGLYGDSLRIKQIIINLLNNAVKYTHDGTVTFMLSMCKVKDSNEIALYIRIRDTGIGIKQEDMEKLFAKFQRIDEQQNMNIEGTGLGMSITKQFVDMMHGTIKVKSNYGEGSEFTVVIPQKITDYTPIGNEIYEDDNEQTYVPTFTASDATILVTDDNPMNRKGIALLLKQTLIRVDMAESGEECISKCNTSNYDIIFLDHQMPGMDGIETIHHITNIIGDTPVIMLTANALTGAKERYMKEGFTDFLSKPVEPMLLEKMVYQYLPDHKKNTITEKEIPKAQSAPMKKTEGLSFFSEEDAMKKCTTKEIFLEMAAEFISSYEVTQKRIEQAYKEKTRNYKISVHALKSNARMVGLNQLGFLAEKQEYLAENGSWDSMGSSHRELMILFEKSYTYMKQHYEKNVLSTVPIATHKKVNIRKMLESLKEAVQEGDLDKIDEVANELQQVSYPYKKELEEAVLLLDYEQIKQLIGNITEEIRKER